MKYFITGHTGFKGAWLTLMLRELGHEVHGYSLDPIDGSLFERANLGVLCASDIRADIRDSVKLSEELSRVSPDVIVHLAAQPLVRYGYEHPEETFTTNIDGTLNVLSSAKALTGLLALLVITTDKVYENTSKKNGYVETDPLGGLDPYSASKAAADILTQSWAHTYSNVPLAIARAGNVIGGGDVSRDRLLPDVMRSFAGKKTAEIRNPDAVRPWQHVLDCLSGYLQLIDSITQRGLRGAWNFGPDAESCKSVGEVVDLAAAIWGSTANWNHKPDENAPHEDSFLFLDSTKAQESLGWQNKLSLTEAVRATVDWEKQVIQGEDTLEVSQRVVREFLVLPN
jgi:CDP-glucose 4,6-dehydratase